jgi:hypothetical protein
LGSDDASQKCLCAKNHTIVLKKKKKKKKKNPPSFNADPNALDAVRKNSILKPTPMSLNASLPCDALSFVIQT